MRRIFCNIFLLLAIVSAFRDVVFLQNGEEIRCNILEISSSKIIINTIDGLLEFPISDVMRITMTHPRPGDEWETIDDVDDEHLISAFDKLSIAEQFPQAAYIVLNHTIKYVFQLDYSCRRTERMTVLILGERGENIFATTKFFFVQPWQSGDIDFCRTIAPDGRIFHLDDSALEFAEPGQMYKQYNFQRRIRFGQPQISAGAIIDFQFHIDYKTVDFQNPLVDKVIFAGDEPILEKRLIIEYPKVFGERFLRYVKFKSPSFTTKDDMMNVVWEESNIMPYLHEPKMAPPEMFMPTVYVSFGLDEAKMLRALQDSLKKSLDGSEKLDKFIDSLVSGAKTHREKLLRIYEYLNVSFHKVSIFPSASRWFPRNVSIVFDDGIANPLDISALMVYMLRHVGVEAKLIYASSFIDNNAVVHVPSLALFDYPFVVAEIEGRQVFCAPMEKYLPPGVIPPNYEGQSALMVGTNGAQIINLPLNSIMDDYARVDTLRIKLSSNGDAQVEIKRIFGNWLGRNLRWNRENRKEEIDNHYQTMAGNFHAGASLVDYSIYGILGFDSTVVERMRIDSPSLAQLAGEKILAMKIPELTYSTSLVGIPTRTTPMWLGEPFLGNRTWIIEVPDHFDHISLLKEIMINGDSLKYSFSATYDMENRTIVINERNMITDRMITVADYQSFRQSILNRASVEKGWIILER